MQVWNGSGIVGSLDCAPGIWSGGCLRPCGWKCFDSSTTTASAKRQWAVCGGLSRSVRSLMAACLEGDRQAGQGILCLGLLYVLSDLVVGDAIRQLRSSLPPAFTSSHHPHPSSTSTSGGRGANVNKPCGKVKFACWRDVQPIQHSVTELQKHNR